MLATYASALLVCAGSLIVGQAVLVLCGWRRWSWLAPPVGLALLLAVAWGTVRLPGEDSAALVAAAVLTAASLLVVWRGTPGRLPGAAREGIAAAVVVLAGASLPFVVEGHFGVLGTSFNPDMGQQLFAADWFLRSDRPEPGLLEGGYPLGPHALAAALTVATGGNLVSAFSGMTIAIPVLAALTALTVLRDLPPVRRAVGAALAGLPYMVASYLAQGLFKELMQALFLLGFALCLHELARGEPAATLGRRRLVAAAPLGVIAIGSVYAYSAPGLVWLGATAAAFAVAELVRGRRRHAPITPAARRAAAPAAVALVVLVVGAAPEIGRMVEFRGTAVDVARAEAPEESGGGGEGRRPATRSGRTSGEAGGGQSERVRFDNRLGNLFNEISPLEALGVWPTGDFRLDPGAGAAPAIVFYACGALGLAALGVGLVRWLRRGETAVPAALAAAVAVYAVAYLASTPYTSAKAVLMIAPLATLIPVSELLARGAYAGGATTGDLRIPRQAIALLALAYVLGAGFSSALALVNAPVGPREYSSALAEFRSRVIDSPATVLFVSPKQLRDEHAEQFAAWDLRGVPGLRIEPGGGETRAGDPPAGVEFVITGRVGPNPPYRGATLELRRDPYRLWRVRPRGEPSAASVAVP
jgi:hypothetical protein